MRFSLFKRVQHKTFTHIPIYYDEKKERLKEMEESARAEQGEKRSTDYHDRMKGSMRRYQHNHRSAAHFVHMEKRRSALRVIVILAILFSVAYLLWKHTETFVEAFLK